MDIGNSSELWVVESNGELCDVEGFWSTLLISELQVVQI